MFGLVYLPSSHAAGDIPVIFLKTMKNVDRERKPQSEYILSILKSEVLKSRKSLLASSIRILFTNSKKLHPKLPLIARESVRCGMFISLAKSANEMSGRR